jgi:hypothetical protein
VARCDLIVSAVVTRDLVYFLPLCIMFTLNLNVPASEVPLDFTFILQT